MRVAYEGYREELNAPQNYTLSARVDHPMDLLLLPPAVAVYGAITSVKQDDRVIVFQQAGFDPNATIVVEYCAEDRLRKLSEHMQREVNHGGA